MAVNPRRLAVAGGLPATAGTTNHQDSGNWRPGARLPRAERAARQSFEICFEICSRARAAVRAGQHERAGLDLVKRACSVTAASGRPEGAFSPSALAAPARTIARAISEIRHVSNDSPLPCADRAGTGRPRPASAVRKTVAARTLAALAVAASKGCTWATDARRTDAPVVAWDLRGSQRPNSPRESPRRFSCFGELRWHASKRDSAARGPLQTGPAAQHRHGPGGQPVILRDVLEICSRARAAVRASQRERAGLDRVKRACSVMAALGWGPSAGREPQGGRRVFPRPR